MYVIFDEEGYSSSGTALEEAIKRWKEIYDHFDLQYLRVVKGVEVKVEQKFIEVQAKAAPKQVTKPAVKKTVSKSK